LLMPVSMNSEPPFDELFTVTASQVPSSS
jgi:hypothetical protein